MDRRRFVIKAGGFAAVVVAGIPMLVGCGNDTGATGPAEETWTSSVVEAHSHQFTIRVADLDQPPAEGMTGDTTSVSAHSHVVTLTQANLKQIGGGGTVAIDTSMAGTPAHAHTFTFSRAGGTTGGGGGGGGGYRDQ